MKLEELINKYYNQLHENDFHILKYVLNHKSSCYELGINSLADKCNVSRSSILRLAQKLGFSGYSEFRVFLKWEDQEGPSEQVSSMEVLSTDIQETLKYTKTKNFHEICELIEQSERIFVYGTGDLQLNCAYELQRMFRAMQRYLHVIRVHSEFEMIIRDVAVRDVVIIISLSGDTPIMVPTVRSIVSKGIPFISITNLRNNVLARMTPFNLYANCSETKLDDGTTVPTFSTLFIVGETLFRKYVEYRQHIEVSQNEES